MAGPRPGHPDRCSGKGLGFAGQGRAGGQAGSLWWRPGRRPGSGVARIPADRSLWPRASLKPPAPNYPHSPLMRPGRIAPRPGKAGQLMPRPSPTSPTESVLRVPCGCCFLTMFSLKPLTWVRPAATEVGKAGRGRAPSLSPRDCVPTGTGQLPGGLTVSPQSRVRPAGHPHPLAALPSLPYQLPQAQGPGKDIHNQNQPETRTTLRPRGPRCTGEGHSAGGVGAWTPSSGTPAPRACLPFALLLLQDVSP